MELLYGPNRKQTCPVRINEDVSLREMGIYHHISAALLRFIQGADVVIDWRGMSFVQYGTPAQGRRQCPTTVSSPNFIANVLPFRQTKYFYLKSDNTDLTKSAH